MELRIRPIVEGDIDGFRAVLDAVARERRYLGFLQAPPPANVRAFVLDNIRKGHPHCVAALACEIVGWCDVLPFDRPTMAHGGVLGVGIAARHRGRGIGTALIRTVLELAEEKGLTRIELTVRAGNMRAATLYERLGFVREGVKRNAVRIDGRYEDLVAMALLLDEAG